MLLASIVRQQKVLVSVPQVLVHLLLFLLVEEALVHIREEHQPAVGLYCKHLHHLGEMMVLYVYLAVVADYY